MIIIMKPTSKCTLCLVINPKVFVIKLAELLLIGHSLPKIQCNILYAINSKKGAFTKSVDPDRVLQRLTRVCAICNIFMVKCTILKLM